MTTRFGQGIWRVKVLRLKRLKRRRGWGILLFAGIFFFAAFWPFSRLELVDVKNGISFYYPLPKDRVLTVIYGADEKQGSEIRRFRVEKGGGLRLLETVYDRPSSDLEGSFEPNRVSRQGKALVVQGDLSPFPELHLVVGGPGKRVLMLGKDRTIDLATLFPAKTLVALRVVRKSLLFFVWKRYLDRS